MQAISPLTGRRINVGGATWQTLQNPSRDVCVLHPVGMTTFALGADEQLTTAVYETHEPASAGFVGSGTTFSVFDVNLRGALLRRHSNFKSRTLEKTLAIAKVMQSVSRCKWVNQLVGVVHFTGPRSPTDNYTDLPRHRDGEWGLLITKVPNASALGYYIKSLPEKVRQSAVDALKSQSVPIARCLWRNRVDFDSAGINNVLIDSETRQLYVIDINVAEWNHAVGEEAVIRQLASYVERMCWSLIEQDRRDYDNRWNGPSDPLARFMWEHGL